MILDDFICSANSFNILRLLFSDCVSLFLDSVFFVFSVSNTTLLYFIFPISHIIICQRFLSYDVIWSSWFTIIIIMIIIIVCCGKNFKTVAAIYLDVSVLFPCLRGPFGTVLNVSSTSNTFSGYKLIYLNILDFLLVTE